MTNRALILALNEHNQAIARSRAEYAAHPNAACGANDYGTLCVMGEHSAEYDHTPLAVVESEGIPFVKCSCPIGYRPQSAVWLREHWQGTQDEGAAALKAVIARQRQEADGRQPRTEIEVMGDPHVTSGRWHPEFLAERLGWAGYEVTDVSLHADGMYAVTMVETADAQPNPSLPPAQWQARHVETGVTVTCRDRDEAEAHVRESASGPWVAEQVTPTASEVDRA